MNIPLEVLEQVYEQANTMFVPRDHPYIRIVLWLDKNEFDLTDSYSMWHYAEIEFRGPKPFRIKSVQLELPLK